MQALGIILLCILVPLIMYIISRRTGLVLDFSSGKLWSLLIYRELFLILIPLILVNVFGLAYFPMAIRNAKDEDSFVISLISIYAAVCFVISLCVFSRVFKIDINRVEVLKAIDAKKLSRFVKGALWYGLLVLAISTLFFEYKHAFLYATLGGENLIQNRLHNAYLSGIPSQLSVGLVFCSKIIAIYSGLSLYKKKIRSGLSYMAVAAVFASAAGDKAPVLMCLVIGSISYYSLKGVKISARLFFYTGLIGLPAVYFLTFLVVGLQISELSIVDFNVYLLSRIGVGQMAGTFETFSIPRLSGDFYWHAIPFASLFVDYPIYDKQLMMAVEGYGLHEMGVKNSLFISEAYGMGGWPLVFASPIVVGFSYALGVKLLYEFFVYFFDRSVAVIYALPIYILTSALTGGFSSFPLFKGLLLTMLTLGVIWFFYQLNRLSLAGTKKNQQNDYTRPHHLPRPIPSAFPRPADPQAASAGHPGVGTGPQL